MGNAIAHPIETAKSIVNYVTNTRIDEILLNNLNQSSSGISGILSPLGNAQRMTKNSMLRKYDGKNGTSLYWGSQGEQLGCLVLEGAITYLGGKATSLLGKFGKGT